MAKGKSGGPLISPWVIDSGTDSNGLHCSITISFDPATLLLTGVVLHRDAGCAYTRALIGVGEDGSPESTTHVFGIGNLEGNRNITVAGLLAVGLASLADVQNLGQITFGF